MSVSGPADGDRHAEPLAPAQMPALLDCLADAVVVVDRAGTICYWDGGAERIFGHRSASALGQRLDLIIPERLRNRHWEAFDASVSSGRSRYGASDLLAVPALTADGKRISIEFTVTLLEQDGRVTQVAAVIREVTARWNEERELRARISQLEADRGSGSTAET